MMMMMMMTIMMIMKMMMTNLAISSDMLAIIRAIEELPVEQLDRDHGKYELEIEKLI